MYFFCNLVQKVTVSVFFVATEPAIDFERVQDHPVMAITAFSGA
jgi:hypothetical protein